MSLGLILISTRVSSQWVQNIPLFPTIPPSQMKSPSVSTWSTAFPGQWQKESAKHLGQPPLSPKLNSTSGKDTKTFPQRNIRSASLFVLAYLILLCPQKSHAQSPFLSGRACKSDAITITLCFPAEGREDTPAREKLLWFLMEQSNFQRSQEACSSR